MLKVGDRFISKSSGMECTVFAVFPDGKCDHRHLRAGPCGVGIPHAHSLRSDGTVGWADPAMHEPIGHDPFLGVKVGDKYGFTSSGNSEVKSLCMGCESGYHNSRSTPHVHTARHGWDKLESVLRDLWRPEKVIQDEARREKAKEGLKKIIQKLPPPWPTTVRDQAAFFIKNPPRHMVSPGGTVDPRLPVVLAGMVEHNVSCSSYNDMEQEIEARMESMLTPRNTFTKRVLK